MRSRDTLFIILLSLTGCAILPPEELDQSIFIPDTDYPELPAYSEWGYNTFGAHLNDGIYLYRSSNPFTAIITNDTLALNFSGFRKDVSISNDVQMAFTLTDFRTEKYADLVALHDKSFDLTSSSVNLIMTMNGSPTKEKPSSGHLIIKRAQHVIVDGQHDRVILSGYFDFQTTIGSKTYSIKDGRFDVGVSEINFYNY